MGLEPTYFKIQPLRRRPCLLRKAFQLSTTFVLVIARMTSAEKAFSGWRLAYSQVGLMPL